MAKLSAHGQEIGRVYFTTSAKAYFSDGKILGNQGFGWKIIAKAKPGANINDLFDKQKQKQIEFLAQRPALAAYRKELHSLAGLSKRWKLHAAIELMPEDADGVWSEVCDGYGDNVHADVNEIATLCKFYLDSVAEQKALKETANA